MHTDAPVILVNVPAEHAAHIRSLLLLPATLTYLPAAHTVMGLHWWLLLVAEK